jgi:hypothetical protein
VLPELTGIGAMPPARASLASLEKRWAPAIAGARSAPASLLHRYEKADDELAPLLRLRSATYDDSATLPTTWVIAHIAARLT